MEPNAGVSLTRLHERYALQAEWTAAIRNHVYAIAGLPDLGRFLEVGSGTGVIAAELAHSASRQVVGLDLDPEACAFAAARGDRVAFTVGRGEQLPFSDRCFDAVICHFLLLWVASPDQILSEMVRTTQPGGLVFCLAEPDYGARIDYPPELSELGKEQALSLAARGADTTIGRKLRGLCERAGLEGLHAGILGAEWDETSAGGFEWPALIDDLASGTLPEDLDRWRRIDEVAWARGERVLFVPTFYAWGRTPVRSKP